MRIGEFEITEPLPDLREPYAFTIIRPWIDVGSVGSITLSLIEDHFGAKELGTLVRPGMFFDFTRYRPTLHNVEDRREVTIPNTVIKYASPTEGPDMIFLHLLEPHSFAEDYSDSILQVLKYFSVSRYCRIGSLYDTVPHTRPLLITGENSGITPLDVTDVIDLRRSTYEGPTTILNLVHEGVPNLGDVGQLSLMVHLPHYFQAQEDYAGVSRMLDMLSRFYRIPAGINPSERGQLQYEELTKSVQRSNELKGLVGQLEMIYDAQQNSEREVTFDIAPFAPEVEQFLEEMDRKFGETGLPNDLPG